jgi:hypothetical protein
MNNKNIEVGVVDSKGVFQVLSKERIQDYLDEVE